MRGVWRWLGVLAVVLLFATAATAALPHFALELLPPHAAKRSTAVLDKALEQAVDSAVTRTNIASVEDAMDLSLSASDRLLHFGLGHPTSLSFTQAEREGNCIEYAHLFARVFDKASAKGKLEARAFVVHSGKARMFGREVPMRGWDDHDWVLIQKGTGDDAERWYVDPTLHDFGLGWDISANVRGAVSIDAKLPAKRSADPGDKPTPQAAKRR